MEIQTHMHTLQNNHVCIHVIITFFQDCSKCRDVFLVRIFAYLSVDTRRSYPAKGLVAFDFISFHLPSSERVKPSRLFRDVSEADRLKIAYPSVGLGVSDPVDQTFSCLFVFLHHLRHETSCNKKMVVWVI